MLEFYFKQIGINPETYTEDMESEGFHECELTSKGAVNYLLIVPVKNDHEIRRYIEIAQVFADSIPRTERLFWNPHIGPAY